MHEKSLQAAKFLIVDDEPANVRVLEQMLDACECPNVAGTTMPGEVLGLYKSFQPDIILLDLMMPDLDGFAVMELLKTVIPAEAYVPILVLTADISSEAKRRALAA